MRKIEFQILGKDWTLRVLKKKKYKRKNGADSVAITKGWKRTIDVGATTVDFEIIAHELVHAYIAEMCASNSTLETDALEELYCELMAKRGRELLDLADSLLARLLSLQDGLE